MFENYKAAQKDFEAIEEGIKTVRKKELKFIFINKKLLDKTSIISFDSQFIYLWSKQKFSELKQKPTSLAGYHLFKIPHQIPITDKEYSVWYASVPKNEFYKFLPKFFTVKSQLIYPRIGGGPLTPFIKIHQKMKKRKEYPLDPYTTKESFLATIVHEFGHVYFEQQYPTWYGIKSYNLKLIRAALNLYEENKKTRHLLVKLPVSYRISELFASCAEYSAAMIFWPFHRSNFDHLQTGKIEQLIKKEAKKNLNWEKSTIDEDAHTFAALLGRIIVDKYPTAWPEFIYKHLCD